MVGTSATRFPAARTESDQRESSATLRITSGSIGFSIAGELLVADVVGVHARRARDDLAEGDVLAHEARRRGLAQAEQVVHHQHLAVATHARADADRGDRELRGDLGAELLGYALEHHRECAGLLDRARVAQHALVRVVAAALHAVAAELVHRLRRQPDVPHHGDLHARERGDPVRHALAALELHRVRPALLYKPTGVPNGVFDAHVI